MKIGFNIGYAKSVDTLYGTLGRSFELSGDVIPEYFNKMLDTLCKLTDSKYKFVEFDPHTNSPAYLIAHSGNVQGVSAALILKTIGAYVDFINDDGEPDLLVNGNSVIFNLFDKTIVSFAKEELKCDIHRTGVKLKKRNYSLDELNLLVAALGASERLARLR